MDFKVNTHPAAAKATHLLAWTRQDLQLPMIKVQTPQKFKLEAQQHYFQHFSLRISSKNQPHSTSDYYTTQTFF